MDAYWRAANYLSVGQIYLYDNPLLKRQLMLTDMKRMLLGHGGTTPALKTRKPGIFEVESEETGVATLGGVYAAGDDARGADLIVTAKAAGR